ncbi:MAG: ribonuclease D [Planctomycetota bacterium]
MYLSDGVELRELCGRARRAGRVGLDVEFIRERTFYPQLALVQLAVEGELVLVDPLGGVDLSPIDELVLDDGVLKILHAATQDLEIFNDRTGEIPRPIFDTQVAAAMVGIGNQVSYGNLVQELLEETPVQGESFTDWLRRPLTGAQERYALEDVRYLLPMHDRLTQTLRELGREAWLEEELERFQDESLYRPDPRSLYRRVRRGGSLKGRGLAVLRELAVWREEEAKRLDRPRRSVISDEILVEVARRAPGSIEELRQCRGLRPQIARRNGKELLDAVGRGRELPKDEWPERGERRRMPPDGQLMVDFLQAVLKAQCQTERVAPVLVGNTRDVESLVLDHLDGTLKEGANPLLEGWRGELVGGRLLEFLEGRLSVHLDPASNAPVFRHRDAAGEEPGSRDRQSGA